MSDTRILVTGKYVDPSTYVLYKNDGTIFQTIKEGESFEIGNQMRSWYPVKVPKKNGRGTILVCRKFGDKNNIIEEFPLVHHKKGLWALTSGAARNGVFHNYHEPENEIEKVLDDLGVSRKIIDRRDTIDMVFEVGGQLCHHCINKWGYGCITDGNTEDITEPRYAPDDHPNQYHVGCMESTYKMRVYDATYALYYEVSTTMNGTTYDHLQKVIITPNANEMEVVKNLKSFQ